MVTRLDAYDTPPVVADVVARSISRAPRTVLDPSCGLGRLLCAVASRFGAADIYGLDKDPNVLRTVRQAYPRWTLSNGDATSCRSLARTLVRRALLDCDLVVMNPPFSMRGARGVQSTVNGVNLRCGTAMHHLLHTCTAFRPKTVFAILPESSLYSETDSQARTMLGTTYAMHVVRRISDDAFRGARPRTHLVRFDMRRRPAAISTASADSPTGGTTARIVRGSLQLFRAKPGNIPLLHTTDLVRISCGGAVSSGLQRVQRMGRGQVRGHFLVLPRVGNIHSEYRPRLLHSATFIQLSDCVVAVQFSSKHEGTRIAGEIVAQWTSFLQLYRGTGAAYTTVGAIRDWLGAHCSSAIE